MVGYGMTDRWWHSSRRHLYGSDRGLWRNHPSSHLRKVLSLHPPSPRHKFSSTHYRYGLSIGARCAPVVLALMWILSPVAYPIAKLLDKALDAESPHTYKNAELKSFLQFHRSGEEPLRDDEISILNGVLELNTKKVDEIMTPIEVHTSFFLLPDFFFFFHF